MGYPMTYQRVVNRNGLSEGDYDHLPMRLKVGMNITPPDELMATMWPHIVERLTHYENGFKMLLGDLRRLEKDSVDEAATCGYIAKRTSLSPDVVAAVLKEFLSW